MADSSGEYTMMEDSSSIYEQEPSEIAKLDETSEYTEEEHTVYTEEVQGEPSCEYSEDTSEYTNDFTEESLIASGLVHGTPQLPTPPRDLFRGANAALRAKILEAWRMESDLDVGDLEAVSACVKMENTLRSEAETTATLMADLRELGESLDRTSWLFQSSPGFSLPSHPL